MTLLAVDGLRVRVATDDEPLQIVDGVSYDVGEGRIFGIAGQSGSGKTVSVLALMGLLPRGASVTGVARFEGDDLVSDDPGAAPPRSAGVRSASSSRTRSPPSIQCCRSAGS